MWTLQPRPTFDGASWFRTSRLRPDGTLTVRSRVHHVNEIVPIVRYWIPHVTIVEPASLQAAMVHELWAYASRYPELASFTPAQPTP